MKTTGWHHLDRDRMRIELFGQGGYDEEDKRYLGQRLRERAGRYLAAGESVIVDGMTLARERDREILAQLARRHGAYFFPCWLDCPIETARMRVQEDRAHPAGDRTPQLVDAVAARFEAPENALRLDATLDTSRLLDLLQSALKHTEGS